MCVTRTDYDEQAAPGVGGQTPAMKALFASFTVGAYIRELGHAADASDVDRERLAAAAGLGSLDATGRLLTRQFGRNVHVADALLTDLPLEADGRL
jgi:epoxyqueuosine reductase QueG